MINIDERKKDYMLKTLNLKKGNKIQIDGMKAEVVEEFTVGIDIKKGTKAAIVKREDGKYIVFNKNQKSCKIRRAKLFIRNNRT